MTNSIEADIERIITGYNRASDGADYAATIVCEAQQVEGDNYRMLWSTYYGGGFAPDN